MKCGVYSGSVADEQMFDSHAGNQSVNTSSTLKSERGNVSTDTESETMGNCLPVTSVRADVITSVRTADQAESGSATNGQTVAEKIPDDNVFRVRLRTTPDNNNSELQKVCEVCGKVFWHYTSFRSHKLAKHAGQPPHRCNARQLPQRTQSGLHNHKSKTHLRLMCEVCGLRGQNHAAFARHMRTYHPSVMGIDNTDAPYQCASCDEKFFQQRILRHHFRLVHAPNIPRIKTSWFRRRQRARNSGLLRCSYCYRCFYQRLALEAHERVHTGDKPYKCEICGRCFRQTVHLTTHRRKHTNERPFECLVCQKAYKNRVDLRKHSTKVHGISLPVKRQRSVGGIDVVAAAVAAANIGPEDEDCYSSRL